MYKTAKFDRNSKGFRRITIDMKLFCIFVFIIKTKSIGDGEYSQKT